MDATTPQRNPMWPVLVALVIAAYLDVQFYFIEHQYLVLGTAAVIPIAVFVVLFVLRSRFAWVASLFAVVSLTAVLLLTYNLGYMGFPLTLSLAALDVLLFTVVFAYICGRRAAYFRYLAAAECDGAHRRKKEGSGIKS